MSTAAAQTVPLQPVTVCEVLANLGRYDKQLVAVLGRYDQVDGLVAAFHRCCTLSEDGCARTLVTEARASVNGIVTGYAWPNRMWVEFDRTGRIQEEPKLDPAAMRAAAHAIGTHTQLGCWEPAFAPTEGKAAPVRIRYRQQWAVVYGRIQTRQRLLGPSGASSKRPQLRGNGFGELGVAPVQLVTRHKIHFLGPKDEPCP